MTIKLARGIAALGKSKFLMMTVAAGIFGLSGAASAEIVTATFMGSVTSALGSAGGLPPASEGDSLVATFVFDLDQSTGSEFIPGSGGEISGPYGSFVTASVTINGVVTTTLPAFNTGELIGQTNVFDIGSIIGVTLLGTGTSYETSVTGTDFALPLSPTPVGYSYDPTEADQTSIFLSDNAGDIIEGDISNASLTVANTPPPMGTPEPPTWAMTLIGFAGFGLFPIAAGDAPRPWRPRVGLRQRACNPLPQEHALRRGRHHFADRALTIAFAKF